MPLWWLGLCWIHEGQDLHAQSGEQGPCSPETALIHPQTSPALLCLAGPPSGSRVKP